MERKKGAAAAGKNSKARAFAGTQKLAAHIKATQQAEEAGRKEWTGSAEDYTGFLAHKPLKCAPAGQALGI